MMQRRALFIAGDLPWPPDGGGRIATLRVLEAYASLFTVDLIAIADPAMDVDLRRLNEICARVTVVRHPFTFGRHPIRQLAVAAASAASRQPYRLRKFANGRLAAIIAEHRASTAYGIAHYDQFGIAQYFIRDLPSTMTHHNVELDLYRLGVARARDPLRKFWLERERDKLEHAESALLPRFDHVFALAPEDADLLRGLGVDRVSVIPMPSPPADPDREPPREPVILSLGSMSWFGVAEGLLWFGQRVLPRVREQVPEVRWQIVGAHAGHLVRELSRQPGVEVLGHVDDLSETVASTRVGIVPLMVAGGIRMKLLDFMAWRIPAVATSLAARGLGFTDGCGAFRRDTPEAFADAVIGLLSDDRLWLDCERRGADYVTANHSPLQLGEAVAAGVDRAVRHHESQAISHV